MSFNPVDDPSIRVHDSTGREEAISLTDLCSRGGEFRGLSVRDPVSETALVRFLIAIIAAAIKRSYSGTDPQESLAEFRTLDRDDQGRIVSDYLKLWRDRFEMDRTTTDRALFQTTQIVPEKWETKSVDERMSYTNPDPLRIKNSHLVELPDALALTCRKALAGLGGNNPGVLVPGNDKAQLSRQNCGLVNSVSAFVVGNTVWDSLVLNVAPALLIDPQDVPEWELDEPAPPFGAYEPFGPLHAFTSPKHNIFVEFSDDHLVAALDLHGRKVEGQKVKEFTARTDPYVFTRSTRDGRISTSQVTDADHLNLLTLLSLHLGQDPPVAAISEQIELAVTMGTDEPTTFRLIYVDAGEEGAKFTKMGRTELPLPLDCLTKPEVRSSMTDACVQAGEVTRARRRAETRIIALIDGRATAKDTPTDNFGIRDRLADAIIGWTVEGADIAQLETVLTSVAMDTLDERLETIPPRARAGRVDARIAWGETEGDPHIITPDGIRARLRRDVGEVFHPERVKARKAAERKARKAAAR